MGILKSKVDVIIPVCHPGKRLLLLLEKLAEQTVLPEKVYLLNVETGWKEDSCEELQNLIYKYFRKHKLFGHKLPLQLEIIPVKEKYYDEGGTRNIGAKHSKSPFLLFMKQDAVPADSQMIEELLWSMEHGAGVVWARHVTGPNAGVLKTYISLYDYPSKSHVRTEEDIKTYGVRAFRMSNACALYRRDIFEAQGGFEEGIISAEGSLFAARLLKAGGRVAYCAEAKVYFSEDSNWMAQFRRKFDEGVAHASFPKVFKRGSEEKDGLRYGKAVLSYLMNQKYYMEIADFVGESLYKGAGYFLGKNYRFLKKDWILKLTNNHSYWSR
ncbi:MAG: glycosyltransferase [Lachnospiraceae bacterium]|nr:glycosyltransferase [Lachnospiraceae bacterium]